jgi:hypothetical protein
MTDEIERRPYTYEDAARVCEVSPETIRARARRGVLKRGRPTNSNRPTVLLSQAEIDAIRNGRPFHPDGRPPGRPDGQPSEQISFVKALQGQITAKDAHLAALERQLAAVERRAERAEERAEKAEHRLIEELARLAGQNVGVPPQTETPASVPEQPENTDFEEMLAELRLEFEGEGRGHSPDELAKPVAEPTQIPESESTVPIVPLVPESRRIWWSRFVPRRRRLT